jgi:hypothetical protein
MDSSDPGDDIADELWWNGRLGDILIYDRALSRDEIVGNYQYLRGRYFTGAFSPENVSGIQAWLRSDLEVARTGNDITSWTDVVNGHVFTRYSAGQEPQYVAGDLNGYPTISFNNGSFCFFENSTLADVFDGLNPAWSVFAVVKWLYSGHRYLFECTKGSAPLLECVRKNASNKISVQKNDGIGGDKEPAGSLDIGAETWYYISNVAAGTTVDVFVSGTLDIDDGDISVASCDFDTCRIGRQAYFWGWTAEIIVYNVAVSNADRLNIESYFAERYGL